MTIYNVTLANTSSSGGQQTWTLLVGKVLINAPEIPYGRSSEICSFNVSDITSLVASVNGNVAEFTYTPAKEGGDKDAQGQWAMNGQNQNFKLAADGNNLTISSIN
ncbi:hypothetical protein E1162_06145 [Rhodobacteraceae bacterium RKSG542]|uniref:hypothetical protein n=1 Tax=Pseudovibrio flavus TaxID=2529854 RepID=UPI0012BC881A|nr:hypothetical protein [Pseudovibrio flavus]MTI16815.1 hypothetical protein [Pseudovibrio flavus]